MSWFKSKKKEAPPPPKPKTLDQMNKDEQKEMHDAIKKDLKDSIREMDRSVFRADMDIKQAKKKLEKMVKKGEDKALLRTYANNVLSAQKNKEKILNNKAKVQDAQFGIDNMFANVKMAGALGDVNSVMTKVNGLMNIGEISKTAMNLQTNMAKMGITCELVEDAQDDLDDQEDYGDNTNVDDLIDSIADKQNGNTNKQGTALVQEEEPQQKDNFDDMLAGLKL